MRVLVVNLGYPPDVIGGAETVVHTLAHALLACGATHVSVAALSRTGVDWAYMDQSVHAYFLAVHPMDNLLVDPDRRRPQRILWHFLEQWEGWSRGKVARLIDEMRPDVANTRNLVGLSTSAWKMARARGLPLVHTCRGYQLLCPFGRMFSAGRTCAQRCRTCRLATTKRRWASNFPVPVVTNSAFTLQAHLAAGYFSSARQYVIPNAPPLEAAQPAASSCSPTLSVAPVAEGSATVRIGYLGRLSYYKGAGVFLSALSRLPKTGWIARAAGTGMSDYVRRLKNDVRRSDLPVDFLGWTNPKIFSAQSTSVVAPSVIAKPQGMVVVEAVSRHVPVVYADHGAKGGSARPQGWGIRESCSARVVNADRRAFIARGRPR